MKFLFNLLYYVFYFRPRRNRTMLRIEKLEDEIEVINARLSELRSNKVTAFAIRDPHQRLRRLQAIDMELSTVRQIRNRLLEEVTALYSRTRFQLAIA